MPIALDPSSPPTASGSPNAFGGSISTASFTAPANSLLVALLNMEVTTPLGAGTFSDSGGLTWTLQVSSDNDSYNAIATAVQVTSAARTVTFTRPNSTAGGNGPRVARLKVMVLTGVDVAGTPVGTVGAGNSGISETNNLTTTSVTPEANGWLIVSDSQSVGTGTGGTTSSDLTLVDNPQFTGGATFLLYDLFWGYKAATAGVGVTGNLNAQGTGSVFHDWNQIVVHEADGGGGTAVPVFRHHYMTMKRH